MNAEDIEALERSNYVSFATRKRSGDWVETPVWFAPDAGSYYVFSAGDAGKVKRLRNFSESRIAACTATGALRGPWHAAEARVLKEPADQDTALAALRRKYGWQMYTADFFSRLTGKMGRRAYIRIDPQPGVP